MRTLRNMKSSTAWTILGLTTVVVLTDSIVLGQCESDRFLGVAEQDGFGGSVAMDGDLFVVSAEGSDVGGFASGSVSVLERQPDGGWAQIATILPTDGSSNVGFGFSVALSGGLLAVGAPFSAAAAPGAGAVHLFQRNPETAAWTFVDWITASDAESGDRFGWSLAFFGDHLIVGAPREDDGTSDAGAAYVFVRDGVTGEWIEAKRVKAADPTSDASFGFSVAGSGTTIAVGATDAQVGSTFAGGAAYVFERDAGGDSNWGQTQKVIATQPASFSDFGHAVALLDDTLLVGAPRATQGNAPNCGLTYVYQREIGGSDAWDWVQTLTASVRQSNGAFGNAIAIQNNIAVISALVDDQAVISSGSASVFERERPSSSWVFRRKVGPRVAPGDENFGASVALSQEAIAVGAPTDGSAATNAGMVYLFELNGADCNANAICDHSEIGEGDATDLNQNGRPDECDAVCAYPNAIDGGGSFDEFGHAVAIDGDTAIIGAPGDDDTGEDAGRVQLFRAASDGTWMPLLDLHADLANGDRFGRALAISQDVCIVGAPFDDFNDTLTEGFPIDSGAVYIFQRQQGGADNWGVVAQLAPSGPGGGEHFGWAVDVDGETAIVGAPPLQSVFVYHRNRQDSTVWDLVATLTPDDPAQEFGAAVAIQGNVIIVGAKEDDDLAPNAGAVYVFEYDFQSEEWTQTRKMTALDGANGDRFGGSVAIDGDTALVGAIAVDLGQASNCGAAYIFQRDHGGPNNWGQVRKLTAGANAQADDEFGSAVTLAMGRAIVGAAEAFRPGFNPGSAYIFDRHRTGRPDPWGFVARIVAPAASENARFGNSLGYDGETIIVGANRHGHAPEATGAAYFLEVGGADCNGNGLCDAQDIAAGADDCNANSIPDECEDLCTHDLNCSGQTDVDDLIAVILAWGDCDVGEPCPADVNSDAQVNVDDLIAVILGWGECQ